MCIDESLLNDLFEGPMEDFDLFVSEYRDRFGSYRCGRLEDDPSWDEYEDTVDLGLSLARC